MCRRLAVRSGTCILSREPPGLEALLRQVNQAKTLIRVPARGTLSTGMKLGRAFLGTVLSPIYWFLAHRHRAPGLKFQRDCALLAFRLLFSGKAPLSYREIYQMLFWPMDSTRYFEFAFMWDAVSRLSFSRYLDVSSPRLFPIILTLKREYLLSDLMNPDLADLASTAELVKALHLESHCNLHGCLVSHAPFDKGSFDVVTSISVVEHIPQDTQAIDHMWKLLKPGGRLLLTLPCAAQSSEQYIDRNEYGLLAADDDGFFFFQRLYDDKLLEERIFSVTGRPRRKVVYGERYPGTHRRCLERKWTDPLYPHWREPYMMGEDFCYFNDLQDLPGEGVIGLEFEKNE